MGLPRSSSGFPARFEAGRAPMDRGTPIHVAMQRTARTHSTSLGAGCDAPYLEARRLLRSFREQASIIKRSATREVCLTIRARRA